MYPRLRHLGAQSTKLLSDQGFTTNTKRGVRQESRHLHRALFASCVVLIVGTAHAPAQTSAAAPATTTQLSTSEGGSAPNSSSVVPVTLRARRLVSEEALIAGGDLSCAP